jgi:hypothetical protein
MAAPLRFFLPVLFLALTLATTACIEVSVNTREHDTIRPSGEVVTRTYDFTDFEAIRISDAFAATIEQAPSYSVVLHIDRNVLEHVEIEVDGGMLMVGLDDDISVRGRFRHEVVITLPVLRQLEVSGASDASIAGVDLADGDLSLRVSGASKLKSDAAVPGLSLHVSGASQVEGETTARELSVDLSGASKLTLSGSAGRVSLKAVGASRLHLDDLEAEAMEVELSGASGADVSVSGTLGPAHLSGASSLHYAGDPALRDIRTTGASSVSPR